MIALVVSPSSAVTITTTLLSPTLRSVLLNTSTVAPGPEIEETISGVILKFKSFT